MTTATAPTAPPRSLEQRRRALNKANRVRSYRAQLKRDLKAGRASVIDVLLEPEEEVETMKVLDVLLAVPKYGRVKALKIITPPMGIGISPSKTVGGLSRRQRVELLATLRR